MANFQFGEEYDPALLRRLRMIAPNGAEPTPQAPTDLQELRSFIQQMPQRQEPSKKRKILAALAGGFVGAGGGPGADVAHQIAQGPYLKQMADFERGVGQRKAVADISGQESENARRERVADASVRRYGAAESASRAREEQLRRPGEYKPTTREEALEFERIRHPEPRKPAPPRPIAMPGREGVPGVTVDPQVDPETGVVTWKTTQRQPAGPVRPWRDPLDVTKEHNKGIMAAEYERTKRAFGVADRRAAGTAKRGPSPTVQKAAESQAWAEALKEFPEFTNEEYTQSFPGVGPILTPKAWKQKRVHDFVLKIDALKKKYVSEAQRAETDYDGQYEEIEEDEEPEEE